MGKHLTFSNEPKKFNPLISYPAAVGAAVPTQGNY